MDEKTLADFAYDEIVEISFTLGFWSDDQELNHRFFDLVHAAVWRALHDGLERQRKELHREYLRHLAQTRQAWLERLGRGSPN